MKKTTLLLLILLFAGSTFAQHAISNYSFENWTPKYGKSVPTGWDVDSVSIAIGLVKRTTGGTQGNYSVQIGTGTHDGVVVTSIISRSDTISSTPTELTFDYKVVNNFTSDKNGLYIEIYFFDAQKKDLADFNWSSSGNQANFVTGKIPFTFQPGKTPKSYVILINYFNQGGIAGEYALVDNLKFTKPGASINTIQNSSLYMYPNPASNTIHIKDSPQDKLAIARFTSLDGRVIEMAIDQESINIEALNNGMYTLEVFNTSNQLVKRDRMSIWH